MKNKLYVAKYSTGSYDEHYVVSVFVSEDKELVEKWVEKFNTKLTYWKEYFKQFGNPVFGYHTLLADFYGKINVDKFDYIMECNNAFIDEVEYRKSKKSFEFSIPEDFYTNREKYFVHLELENPRKKE